MRRLVQTVLVVACLAFVAAVQRVRAQEVALDRILAVVNGDYGTASALASLLLGITAIAVYAAFRASGRRDTSFL